MMQECQNHELPKLFQGKIGLGMDRGMYSFRFLHMKFPPPPLPKVDLCDNNTILRANIIIILYIVWLTL